MKVMKREHRLAALSLYIMGERKKERLEREREKEGGRERERERERGRERERKRLRLIPIVQSRHKGERIFRAMLLHANLKFPTKSISRKKNFGLTGH